MTDAEIASARADIEATTDLLERAMKLSGLVTTLFQERGFPLVVVGGSAVEFYTEGGYMSGDIDFCRKTLASVPPRLMQEVAEKLGGKGVGRNWLVCGLYIDLLGLLESETALPERVVRTPYGDVKILPPELALVERILFADQDAECVPSARQMMAAALRDPVFNWEEAVRLADLPDFKVLPSLRSLKRRSPMPSPEPIVQTWEEWQASRAAKRKTLAQLGLEAPSRRRTAIGSQERRLRKAFEGQRAPKFT